MSLPKNENTKVDITGIDRMQLVNLLWHTQKHAAIFENIWVGCRPQFDKEEAKSLLDDGYIDYLCGKCFKCDLTSDMPDTSSYDRQAGKGTFALVVGIMRGEPDKKKISNVIDQFENTSLNTTPSPSRKTETRADLKTKNSRNDNTHNRLICGSYDNELKVYLRCDGTAPITGLDRLERLQLFRLLWNGQVYDSCREHTSIDDRPQFDETKAMDIIDGDGYIDLFCGKRFKCDLTSDMPDTRSYDEQAGRGKFAQIAFRMRTECYRKTRNVIDPSKSVLPSATPPSSHKTATRVGYKFVQQTSR